MTNKQKVIDLLKSLETGDQAPMSNINPNKYIQHNLGVADGLAGFGEVFKHMPPQGFKANVVRAFEHGDFVFAHTEYDFFGPKIGFDIFRFEDGLIVEHWDNLQTTADKNPSGRTMIDGVTEVTDLDKTDSNVAKIKDFVDQVMIGGDGSKMPEYVSTTSYIQHNPGVGDGMQALGKSMQAMAEQGSPMKLTANHIVLGEGNFVLSVSEGEFMSNKVAFYDLFRLENGLVVEHWDTIETIPPKEEWKNKNGKFGFSN